MKKTFTRLCAALALGAATAAFGQAYPTKPIRIIVGFPPGGGNDIIARLVASKMEKDFGKPVVVDNKPGAASIIASEYVAKSAPDGYTLLVNATGGMSANPVLYHKLPYDSIKDFAPLTIFGSFPLVLIVNNEVPAKTLQEFIAYAKANPGKLNYSSGSSSFQIATEMFKQMTGTDIRHIPYKGSAASIKAVMANETQMDIVDTPPALPQIKGGRVRALAVTSAKRSPELPDVPAVAEVAPGYEVELWIGLFAPAKTPKAIVNKLSKEAIKITHMPDVTARLKSLGVGVLGSTPKQVTARIKSEIAKYRPVVEAAHIQVQ